MGPLWPGALSFAVFCEAIAARCFMRKVLRGPLAEHASPPPGWKSIAVFYWPLAITPLIGFIGRPIGSTAMAQMPNPVDTLAVWGPLMGSTFLLQCGTRVQRGGGQTRRRPRRTTHVVWNGTRRGRVGVTDFSGLCDAIGGVVLRRNSWSRAAVGGVGPLCRVVRGPDCHFELHAFVLAGLLGSLSQNQSHHRKCGVLSDRGLLVVGAGCLVGQVRWLGGCRNRHQRGLFGPRPLAVVAGRVVWGKLRQSFSDPPARYA